MVFLSGVCSKKGKKLAAILKDVELPALCNLWVEGTSMSFGTHFVLTGFYKEVLIGKELLGEEIEADVKIPIKDVKVVQFPDFDVRVEL